MSQDVPFDKFLGRRVADRLSDVGRLGGLRLARQIDRVLDRREIAREWRRGGRFAVARRCRFARRRLGIRHIATFAEFGFLVMPRARRLGRLPGMLGLLLADERSRIVGNDAEHRQGGEETSQQPEALVHFVVPLRTNRHEP